MDAGRPDASTSSNPRKPFVLLDTANRVFVRNLEQRHVLAKSRDTGRGLYGK
jgi:hypothetical protein